MGLSTLAAANLHAFLAKPKPIPPGPFAPEWDSIREHYRGPAWLDAAKFGIFLHWGLYALPAYHNEWYEAHVRGVRAVAYRTSGRGLVVDA